MKKNIIIAGALLLAVFVFPAISSAQNVTIESLQAEIQQLLAEINSLQAQIAAAGGSTNTWCYTFNTNLSIGMNGPAVTALQTALQKDGESVSINGNFDDLTASAVTSFQEKYASDILTPNGLSNGTGYAGAATRTKLNSFFSCSISTTNPGTLTITSPKSGDILSNIPNTNIANIQWTYTGPVSNNPIEIILENSAGSFIKDIVPTLPSSDVSYTWQADPSIPNGVYKIGIYYGIPGSSGSFTLTGPFTLTGNTTFNNDPGTFTITSPKSGDILSNIPNTNIANIQWTYTGPVSNNPIEIMLENSAGSFIKDIVPTLPSSDVSYTWQADPSIPNGVYKIGVFHGETGGLSSPFTLISNSNASTTDPVINSFSMKDSQEFSLSANNVSSISFQVQCGTNLSEVYINTIGLGTSLSSDSPMSICNAPQFYKNLNVNTNINLVDAQLYTFNNSSSSGGLMKISTTKDTTGTITVNACNLSGKCVQKSTQFPVYAKACLATGTKISMADGNYKNIENINIGDIVKSFNGSTVKNEVVSEVFQREDPIITINGVLKAASDEVIYLANGKTETASQVKIGDELFGEGGNIIKVFTIGKSDTLAKTYDLSLENGNTFFADGYLVQAPDFSN